MSAVNTKQHDKLHHSQYRKERVQEQKERNYRAIFRNREHRCWNNRGEDTCVNLHWVINEDTLGNPVYMDENGKIYNSIYNTRRVCQQLKKWQTSFK